MYYMGMVSDQVHGEWTETVHKQWLAQKFKQGELKVPGFELIASEPPVEHVEAPPSKPLLKRLCWSGNGNSPEVPTDLLTHWCHHAQHGEAFRTWLDGFSAEFAPTAEAGC
jgi:hypothetical protein